MSTASPPGLHQAPQGWWSRFAAGWSRLLARVPLGLALAAVTAVWAFGAVWSFTEQSAFARAKGFTDPALLPLVLDGLAVAMAGVAFAASLDARPAIGARLGTALAVAASASSNGLWAAERSTGPAGPDWTTVAIGAGIPIAANIAFEVLLGELRRQVQRRRGLPAPVALPSLRVLRLVLAPRSTFRDWRDEVLTRTAPGALDGGSEPLVTGAGKAEAIDVPDEVAPAPADEVAPQRCLATAGPAGPALPGPPPTPPPSPTLALALALADVGTESSTNRQLARTVPPVSVPDAGSVDDGGSVAEDNGPAGRESRTPDAGEDTDTEAGEETGAAAQAQPEAELEDAGEVDSACEGALPGDARVRLLRELLDAGAPVTGAQAAMLLSHTYAATSGRTGRRLLAEARQPLTASSPAPGAPDEAARTGTEHSRGAPGPAAVPLSLVRRPSSTPGAGELP